MVAMGADGQGWLALAGLAVVGVIVLIINLRRRNKGR